MNKKLFIPFLFLLSFAYMFGESDGSIAIPKLNDDYSKGVAALEKGDSLDFAKFRYDYAKSKQFIIAFCQLEHLDSLKANLKTALKANNVQEIKNSAQAILSIDYTSLNAHRFLGYAYGNVRDTLNQAKHLKIMSGLFNSIMQSGDGKSCASAWKVVSVEEEYFVINSLGAKITTKNDSQYLRQCDQLKASRNDKEEIFFFDISNIIDAHTKEMDAKK